MRADDSSHWTSLDPASPISLTPRTRGELYFSNLRGPSPGYKPLERLDREATSDLPDLMLPISRLSPLGSSCAKCALGVPVDIQHIILTSSEAVTVQCV